MIVIPVTLARDNCTLMQTELLRLMCFTSCPGGIARRITDIIFEVVFDGQVLCQQRVGVRICACPSRDRRQREQKMAAGVLAHLGMQDRGTCGGGGTDVSSSASTGGRSRAKIRTDNGERSSSSISGGGGDGGGGGSSGGGGGSCRQKRLTRRTRTVTAIARSTAREERDRKCHTLKVKGRENYELVRKVVASLHRERLRTKDRMRTSTPKDLTVVAAAAASGVGVGGGGAAVANSSSPLLLPSSSSTTATGAAPTPHPPLFKDATTTTTTTTTTRTRSSDSFHHNYLTAAAEPSAERLALVHDVFTWLEAWDLDAYADTFMTLGYDDLELMEHLDSADMDTLNLPQHPNPVRKRLARACNCLARALASSAPSSPSIKCHNLMAPIATDESVTRITVTRCVSQVAPLS